MDQVQFKANWQKRELKEAKYIVNEFMKHDKWIIEGNFHALNDYKRYEEADLIIFLDFNRFICFKRAIKRALIYHNTQRDDLPLGCYDSLNLSFIYWILFEGRSKKKWQKKYQNIKNKYANKFITLHNEKEIETYLSSLTNS